MSSKTKARQAKRRAQAARRRRTRREAPAAEAPPLGQSGEAAVSFRPAELMRMYLAKDWDALSRTFLRLLGHFARYTRRELSAQDQYSVDMLVQNLLYFFTKADYEIPEALAEDFLRLQPAVANLVAASAFRTTNAQVDILLRTRGNLVKLLTLYNARNTIGLDRRRLFDIDPYYASIWYAAYFFSAESFATETTYRNMREHVAAMDERYVLFGRAATTPFFKPTYIDFEADKAVKGRINALVRSACASVQVRNRPREGRIAVVTQRWMPTTSVYRSISPFVAALRDDYAMTLVHVGPDPVEGEKLDDSLFVDVRRVQLTDGGIAMGDLLDNDFQLVYFADVGMTRETIYLANLRLAPVQVTGYGHPVSTFGSQIDYYIGSADAEIAADAERNYSERLVLIPGLGAHPVYPDYAPRRPAKDIDAAIVNCPWTPMKVNYPLLTALRQVARRAGRRVVFRFFPGSGLARLSAFIPFCRDVESVLGREHVDVVPNCPQVEYMTKMEMGDLSADSYPFGGYNTVMDSLYLGKPVVTWQGREFVNRASSCLLGKLGLGELVARNAEEYAVKILRLADDEAYRTELSRRIRRADLKGAVYDSGEPAYFKKAIDFLIAQHDRLQAEGSREPIFIT